MNLRLTFLKNLLSQNLSEEARQEALRSCRAYFTVLSKCPSFYNLEYRELREIVSHSRINCVNEDEIFHTLNLWATLDNKRCFEFEELLQLVRFNFMDTKRLQSLLEDQLFTKTFHGVEYVKDALAFKELSEIKQYMKIKSNEENPRYQRRIPVECFYIVGFDIFASAGKLWRFCPFTHQITLVHQTDQFYHLSIVHQESIYFFSTYGMINRYDVLFDRWQEDAAFMEDCERRPIYKALTIPGDNLIYTITSVNKLSGTYILRKYDPKMKSSTSWYRMIHDLGEYPEFIVNQGSIYIIRFVSGRGISGVRYNPYEDTLHNISTFNLNPAVRPLVFSHGNCIYTLRDSNKIDRYDVTRNEWTEGIKILSDSDGADILDRQCVAVVNNRVYFMGRSCKFYTWKPDENDLVVVNDTTISETKIHYILT